MRFTRPIEVTGPSPQRRPARWNEPNSWLGAIVVMLAFTAVLWVVQAVNAQHSLVEYGLQPRDATGLRGVVTEPFLHASWNHLWSNTVPFLVIGFVVLLSGLRTWLLVTATVVVGGGLLTWLVAPSNQVIVGASGLVFGWLGYLLARALFERSFRLIATAILVLVFFGALLFGLLPSQPGVSWEAHVCGFVAGIAAAAALHRRPAR